MRPDVSENSQISPSTIVRAARAAGSHPTSRQSCCKAGKARIFTPVRESSGESRLNVAVVSATAMRRIRPAKRWCRPMRNSASGNVPLAWAVPIVKRWRRKIGFTALIASLLVSNLAILRAQQPNETDALNKQVLELYRAGRLSEALPLARRQLTLSEAQFGPDDPRVGIALGNLASLYFHLGRDVDAESLGRRALRIFENSPNTNQANLATALVNLADTYRIQSRYREADPLFKRALNILEKTYGPNAIEVASLLNSLANMYDNQGRRAEAEALNERALIIYRKARHPNEAHVLNSLAASYHEQGRNTDAERFYESALASYQQSFGKDHLLTAVALTNFAGFYGRQKRYSEAESFAMRALTIREKGLGREHPLVANTLNTLMVLNFQQGRYSDAERFSKRALAIQEKSHRLDHPDVALSLRNLAQLYRVQEHYAEALPVVRVAMSRGIAAKDVTFPVLFQSQRRNLISNSEALSDSYKVLQRVSSSVVAQSVSQLGPRFAAATGALSLLVRNDQDLILEAEALDRTLIAEISKSPAQRSAATEERLRGRMSAIRAKRDELKKTPNQKFPEYAVLSEPPPLSTKETQDLLDDDEALIVFDFDVQSFAWVFTKTTGAKWIELSISAEELSDQVKSLRKSLTFDVDEPFDAQLAFKIYQSTFGMIYNTIASKTRLSIVTNGALTSLPLQLLVTDNPSGKPLRNVDWLVRSHSLTVLPSVASLKILRAKSPNSSASKGMVAFADPVFKNKEAKVADLSKVRGFYQGVPIDLAGLTEALRPLASTANEVREVSGLIKGGENKLYLRSSASETNVKNSKLDEYRIVYFATHGLVAGQVEMFVKAKVEPALALSIPDKPTDVDNGLLMASEVAQLKLNADWVVLSACNTAAESKPGSEALSGLASAFFYAGARSLVVSHWVVDSRPTVKIMIGAFQASSRDAKLSHAEGFRQSLLSMLDAAKSDIEAHPRLWAPFVVVGEPRKPS